MTGGYVAGKKVRLGHMIILRGTFELRTDGSSSIYIEDNLEQRHNFKNPKPTTKQNTKNTPNAINYHHPQVFRGRQ